MKLPIKSVLLVVVILALASGFVAALSAKPSAPSVEFTSLKGEKITMESLRGKVVLVNFWATDCPGCIAEMPELIQTHHKYNKQGLETIAVAMSYDPPNYVLTYAEKNSLPFIVSLDPTGVLSKAFDGVQLTPTTFVIDKRGRILLRTVGVLNFPELHALLEKELKSST
jgi:peroxiredoxin